MIDYKNIDVDKFGALIKSRLVERGINIKRFSYEVRLSQSLISMALNGKRRISPKSAQRIIEFLEIEENEIPYVSIDSTKKIHKGKKIFISYSHKDHSYVERLMVHLKPLEKQGLIDPWVDTRLLAGDKWKKEIEKALKSAKVGILLISADFLASDFIIDNELPPILHDAEEAGTLIIPVILKPCRFTREENLREFQSINPPDEPLCLLDENDRELIYDSIAQRIEDTF